MITLESSAVFGPLEPATLAALRQIAQERVFPAQAEIFRQGDAGEGLYFIVDGRIEISAQSASGERRVFGQVGPGEILGEMAVIEHRPRSATALATQKTVLYFFPRQEMLELIEQTPALAMTLLREISGRLRDFNAHYLREMLQAERLSMLGRFTRSIVHDLKNPLNIIGLTAEVAGMPQISPAQRTQAVQSIRQQVDRISEMISEILDFTQAGQSTFLLTQIDYRVVVEPILEELCGELHARAVVLEIESSVPTALLALNPKRLRRVFFNLAHNAAEAMPEGGILRIRFQRRPGELVTELEDSGPGLAPEVREHLFEPFATFGKRHGTGLGLSICKRIVEEHKGWITARNQPQGGAVFAFGLPLAKAPEPPQALA